MRINAGRNTLVDDAADKIRQMIFEGEIKPGELLPPRKELAAHFGVGISTIHEAVKSLDARSGWSNPALAKAPGCALTRWKASSILQSSPIALAPLILKPSMKHG